MNTNYLKIIIDDIFLTDSPSGFSKNINNVLSKLLKELNYSYIKINNKGNLELFIKGESNWTILKKLYKLFNYKIQHVISN